MTLDLIGEDLVPETKELVQIRIQNAQLSSHNLSNISKIYKSWVKAGSNTVHARLNKALNASTIFRYTIYDQPAKTNKKRNIK